MYPLMNVSAKPTNANNHSRLKERKEKHFASNPYGTYKASAEYGKAKNKTHEEHDYKRSSGIHNNLLCGFVKIVLSKV